MLILAQHHRATSMGVDRPYFEGVFFFLSWMYIFWAVTQIYYSRTLKKLLQPLNCMCHHVRHFSFHKIDSASVCVRVRVAKVTQYGYECEHILHFSWRGGRCGNSNCSNFSSPTYRSSLSLPFSPLVSFLPSFFHLPSPPFSRAHLLFASVIWPRDQYV